MLRFLQRMCVSITASAGSILFSKCTIQRVQRNKIFIYASFCAFNTSDEITLFSAHKRAEKHFCITLCFWSLHIHSCLYYYGFIASNSCLITIFLLLFMYRQPVRAISKALVDSSIGNSQHVCNFSKISLLNFFRSPKSALPFFAFAPFCIAYARKYGLLVAYKWLYIAYIYIYRHTHIVLVRNDRDCVMKTGAIVLILPIPSSYDWYMKYWHFILEIKLCMYILRNFFFFVFIVRPSKTLFCIFFYIFFYNNFI